MTRRWAWGTFTESLVTFVRVILLLLSGDARHRRSKINAEQLKVRSLVAAECAVFALPKLSGLDAEGCDDLWRVA